MFNFKVLPVDESSFMLGDGFIFIDHPTPGTSQRAIMAILHSNLSAQKAALMMIFFLCWGGG